MFHSRDAVALKVCRLGMVVGKIIPSELCFPVRLRAAASGVFWLSEVVAVIPLGYAPTALFLTSRNLTFN